MQTESGVQYDIKMSNLVTIRCVASVEADIRV